MLTASEQVERNGYARLDRSDPDNPSKPEFLAFIHAVNAKAEEWGMEPIFGKPEETGEMEGYYFVEKYPEARVVFKTENDHTAVVAPTSDRARAVMEAVSEEEVQEHMP